GQWPMRTVAPMNSRPKKRASPEKLAPLSSEVGVAQEGSHADVPRVQTGLDPPRCTSYRSSTGAQNWCVCAKSRACLKHRITGAEASRLARRVASYGTGKDTSPGSDTACPPLGSASKA